MEAPTAVLFHATVIHCYHGIEIADALFSFRNECYRLALIKFHSGRKDRETVECVELSRKKHSRQRVCSQNLATLVAKV